MDSGIKRKAQRTDFRKRVIMIWYDNSLHTNVQLLFLVSIVKHTKDGAKVRIFLDSRPILLD